MKNAVIGALLLLVLILAAVVIRMGDRERDLERRLAANERRPARTATASPVVDVAAPLVPELPKAAPPRPSTPPAKDPPAASAAPATTSAPEWHTPAAQKALGTLQGATIVLTPEGTAQLLPDPPDPVTGRRPGFLGINGQDAKGGGAEISQVIPGSVAAAAGLQAGDVILAVNDEPVSGLADLAARIRRIGEFSPISLRVRRDNREFFTGAQLGSRQP